MTDDNKQLAVRAEKLPKPANPAATLIVNSIDRFIPAIPRFVDTDAFLHAIVVAANESDIADCTDKSVMMSAYSCVKLGLLPGRTLDLCYFVPFKENRGKQNEQTLCQLIIGYRGYLELASRNRFLSAVHTEVVYPGEDFRYWIDETGPRLTHEPDLERDVYGGTRPVAAYCVAQLASGGRQIRLINASQLAKAMRDTPAWEHEAHEQYMKTAIRRAAKQWSLTPEMALAVKLDEAFELGKPQDMPVIEGDVVPAGGVQPVDDEADPLLGEPVDAPQTPAEGAAQEADAEAQGAADANTEPAQDDEGTLPFEEEITPADIDDALKP